MTSIPSSQAGSMSGSGAIIVLDDSTDIVEPRWRTSPSFTPTKAAANAPRAAKVPSG
jgi:NADH:ubiquinone oxidoreductase subunit F (NADH-binding)